MPALVTGRQLDRHLRRLPGRGKDHQPRHRRHPRALPVRPRFHLACSVWSPDAKRLACGQFDSATDPSRNGMYTIRSSDGGGLRGDHVEPGRERRTGRLLAERQPDRLRPQRPGPACQREPRAIRREPQRHRPAPDHPLGPGLRSRRKLVAQRPLDPVRQQGLAVCRPPGRYRPGEDRAGDQQPFARVLAPAGHPTARRSSSRCSPEPAQAPSRRASTPPTQTGATSNKSRTHRFMTRVPTGAPTRSRPSRTAPVT